MDSMQEYILLSNTAGEKLADKQTLTPEEAFIKAFLSTGFEDKQEDNLYNQMKDA